MDSAGFQSRLVQKTLEWGSQPRSRRSSQLQRMNPGLPHWWYFTILSQQLLLFSPQAMVLHLHLYRLQLARPSCPSLYLSLSRFHVIRAEMSSNFILQLIPFPPPSIFPASGSSQFIQLLQSGSAKGWSRASVFSPSNEYSVDFQDWLLTLCRPRLQKVFLYPAQKHQFFSKPNFSVTNHILIHDYWKTMFD